MNDRAGDAYRGGAEPFGLPADVSTVWAISVQWDAPAVTAMQGANAFAAPPAIPWLLAFDSLTAGTIANPPGSWGGNWGSGPGGGLAAAYSQPTGNGPPGPSNPASPADSDPSQDAWLARAENQAPPLFAMNAPPVNSFPMFAMMRGRSDPFEGGTSPAGPLIATPSVNGPGAQAIAPLATNVSAVTAGAVSALPAAQGGVVPRGQLAVTADSEPHGGDPGAALAVGSLARGDGRGTVDPGRPASSPGQSVPATALSHSVLRPAGTRDSSSADGGRAELLPRGADLIAEALPFVGDSLEQSLDAFVRQLKEVDVAAGGPAPIVVATLAALGTATVAVAVQGIVRRRSSRGGGIRMVDSLGRELALSFPELPRSWSEKR
jgi:hypothetical protein